MQITVNGDPREIPQNTTVADLIETLGLSGQPCAAEVNKSLVPKRAHESHRLEDGDSIELVTLVGGG
ncbi:MAG: sulfur carrier protein ThiS [Planctomycetota bacterium]